MSVAPHRPGTGDATASPSGQPAEAPPAFKASNREIFVWGTSQATNGLIESLGANITPFFNTALGLNAGLIGVATVIPRILDALTDPLMGHISDNTHTRWGRRRPYIFAGAFITAFFIAAMWWASPAWSQGSLFVWLALGLLLFGVANTIIQTPLGALGLELTDDYHQRTKVQSVKFFFGALMGLGIPWIYWLALRPVWGGEIQGFRAVYFLVALLIIALGVLPAIFCKERFQRSNEKPVSVWSDLLLALRNPYFRRIIYVRLSNAMGAIVFGGMNFYINVYYICQGDKSLAMKIGGIGGTVYSILSFGMIAVMPQIGRTIGKRRAMLTGFGLQLVLAFIQPWIQTPDRPYLQLVGVVLAVPAGLMANIFVSSFMPDVCDLGELQNGRRMEGTYGAVAGFLGKVEGTLLAVVVGFMINLSGFDPSIPHQSVEVQSNVRWLAYIPNYIFSILTFWFAWRFKVDHKLMAETRTMLNARHEAEQNSPS